MASLKVIRPGMLTTVQDLGRWGHQAEGVPVAGAMDVYSHRLANRLVGNEDHVAALEITLVGPELEASGDVACAVAGARFEMAVDGRAVATGHTFHLKGGSRLQIGPCDAGARGTLAVRGGVDVPRTLGSCATSLISRMGPFNGRPLVAGDVVPVGLAAIRSDPGRVGAPLALPQGGARVRAIPGPHDAMFGADVLEAFFASAYTVSTRSNRMGYRLDGPSLAVEGMGEILSDATPVGSVQVPPSGQPILLMADRQTTGGYPKIATVITADLPAAAQLGPGDWIRFTRCTAPEALAALRRLEQRLSGSAP